MGQRDGKAALLGVFRGILAANPLIVERQGSARGLLARIRKRWRTLRCPSLPSFAHRSIPPQTSLPGLQNSSPSEPRLRDTRHTACALVTDESRMNTGCARAPGHCFFGRFLHGWRHTSVTSYCRHCSATRHGFISSSAHHFL
jgi:hypothetical protein